MTFKRYLTVLQNSSVGINNHCSSNLGSVVRTGPLIVTSSAIKAVSSNKEHDAQSITCLETKRNKLAVLSELNLQVDLHCVAASGDSIIAAGADGRVCVWRTASVLENCAERHDLPQAKYMDYVFDSIVELTLPQGRENWVLGVSSQGSIVLWNYCRREILTTVHHAMFQVSELHVLPSEDVARSGNEDEDSLDAHPLAFIGTLKERDNSEAGKSVAAMLLRKDILSVGCLFPVEGVQQLCGHDEKGLMSIKEGRVTAWDIITGKCIWWTNKFAGKKVKGIWMGKESVAAGTECASLLVLNLSL